MFSLKNKAVECNPFIFYVFYTILLYTVYFFWSLVNITPGYVVTKTSKKIFFSNMKRKETMQCISKKSNWSPLEIIGTEFHLLLTIDRCSCLNSTRNEVYVGIELLLNLLLKCCVKPILEAVSLFFFYIIKFDLLNNKKCKP